MRILMMILTLCFAQASFANSHFAGDWCKKYDDFTEAYKITESSDGGLDVKTYTIGNSSGEMHGYYEGYLSMGASSVVFVLNGVDQELADVTRSFDFVKWQKKIHFSYNHGPDLTLTECVIVQAP